MTDSGPNSDDHRSAAPATAAGQGLADLLVLGALSCQTPVAVLSVPQPGGGWSTLSHGFDHRNGLNDGALYEAIAAGSGPVELTDMVTSLPRSPMVHAPHAMRWAYGVALRDGNGMVTGVVAVMDRWLRQLSKREQRAMAALARQISTQLAQLRRPVDAVEPVAMLRQVPRAGSIVAPRSAGRASGAASDAPQLLRSHEVATIFDVTERTVINWAAAGKLPSLRTIGGHLRFRRDDVMRLLSGAGEMPG
ncbi:MAG TPA: helix-turn-helix domain-containing protein [Acidimicrobiales bacterium]|nr:helix-turn-helix domain-containing protein [Acidimicrobiales bacterium]